MRTLERTPFPLGRCATNREGGLALVLALGVLMVVTLTVGILEESIDRSSGFGRQAIAKVRAEYAGYGGAVRAAANPPDAFTSFDYLGTRVEVTLSDPPVSLIEVLMANTPIVSATDTPFEGSLRMMTSAVAIPEEGDASESTWHYLLIESDRPTLWTAWPGYHLNSLRETRNQEDVDPTE